MGSIPLKRLAGRYGTLSVIGWIAGRTNMKIVNARTIKRCPERLLRESCLTAPRILPHIHYESNPGFDESANVCLEWNLVVTEREHPDHERRQRIRLSMLE